MRSTSLEKLKTLQRNPSGIRNICILAHVDHGKTTLADTLVASNGIISQRMAGKLRYMDSREDEQLRGITMKSSAISLHYDTDGCEYLVNLVDSPGHVDFSSEVSTAVRLCDGAIVLVDVVEGICPQTHAVLRQAWLENIKPVLVLNKVDRLICELKMSPVEAYIHLQHILEQVNAIMAELFTSHHLENSSNQKTKLPSTVPAPPAGETIQASDQVYDWSSGLEDTDDSNLYFSPDQANVIFTSAIDGWGFGIQHFAELYAAKLGFKAEVLNKTLWGDFYLETKTKRIKRGAQARGKKPLFVQFILDNLWAVYDAVLISRDTEMTDKIVRSMKLHIHARDTRHDPRVHLQAITGQWLPLSQAVLSMVVQCLPSPLDVTEERVEKLICSNAQRFDTLPAQTQQLKTDFMSCSPGIEAPVIVYISKMFTVDWKSLPKNKQRRMTEEDMVRHRQMALQRHANKMAALAEASENSKEPQTSSTSTIQASGTIDMPPPPTDPPDKPIHQPDDQMFIAFARVFSGTVKPGAKLYVLGPKHDPALALDELEDSGGDESVLSDLAHITSYTVTDLYMFMGKELEAMDEVPAGNLLGLGGLGDAVLKSATLSSTVSCPAFTDMYFEAAPIVRVALEPAHPGDMKQLREGLRLLNQADPCVRVFIQGTGEHVIMAAGEVHLQKCLDDLRDKYAKVEVNVSPPIVPFRETIIIPPTVDNVNELIEAPSTRPPPTRASPGEEEEHTVASPGVVQAQTANRLCCIRVRTEPLPETVTQLLDDHSTLILTLDIHSAKTDHSQLKAGSRINAATLTALREFRNKLESEFDKAGGLWQGAVDKIWSFGPKKNGPNILLNLVPEYSRPSIWSCLNGDYKPGQRLWDFDNSIVSGFQMAALAGPLCEEPMRGVGFILEMWETDKELRLKERKISERERKASDGERAGRERRVSERVRTVSGLFGDDIDDDELDTWHNTNLNMDIGLNMDTSLNMDMGLNADIPQGIISTHDTDSISQESEIVTINGSGNLPANAENLTQNKEAVTKMVKLSISEACSRSDATVIASSVIPSDTHQKDIHRFGPFTGQLMSCMKETCRRAFMSQPQRLMVAMYSCVIQATAEVLGKLYGVLGKRHGRILHDEMREGTSYFNISAVLPVIESFGFAEEIRKKTSGLASPQLKFSHWEVLDMDPFWVPTTDEEYLHYGEKADSLNEARQYMNTIRRRKGLKVQEKLVEFAEKQRTLSRNK